MPNQQKPSFWRRLHQWLSHNSVLPDSRKHDMLGGIPLLAVDLELTSLAPQKSQITSIGWVEGKAGSMDLNTCFYTVIRTSGDLEQSPVIHGLIADEIAQGEHIKKALEQLVPYAKTHVWVFHNAGLDIAVLDKVFASNGMYLPEVITLDTLKLAVYQLQKQHDVLPPNSATLAVCRQRLNLPLAPEHNALDDAVATLQLWFAQYYRMDPCGKMRLQDIAYTQALGCKNLGESGNK